MTERRRAARHGVRGPVAFRVQNWYLRRGSVLDLCMDGCLIAPQLVSGCEPGDALEIHFEIKGVAFRAQCVVRRVSVEGLLGIELTHLSERAREELRLLLQDAAGAGATP
jgi:hypothetical protein